MQQSHCRRYQAADKIDQTQLLADLYDHHDRQHDLGHGDEQPPTTLDQRYYVSQHHASQWLYVPEILSVSRWRGKQADKHCGLFNRLEYAPTHLVQFDGLEQGFEVAFAEAIIALALDDLEEDGADLVFGKDLQQQAAFGCAVQQNLILLQAIDVFAMIRQAAIKQLVVGVWCVQKLQSGAAQLLDRLVDVFGGQRNMLNAFAAVQIQILLNLPFLVRAFFVDRNADVAARRSHGLGFHAGDFAFNVEITNFAEIEQALIELRPFVHAAFMHVVRQVVHDGQPGAHVMQVIVCSFNTQRLEVDVVDADVADTTVAGLALPAVHQINQ